MDDRQLAEVKKALMTQKTLLRTYWTSIADLTNLFATGEVVCAFSWLPPYYDLTKRGLKMGLSLPKEGVLGWCDELAIPAGVEGEKLDAAYQFINYLLGPDYGMKLAYGGPYAQSTSVIRDKLPPDTAGEDLHQGSGRDEVVHLEADPAPLQRVGHHVERSQSELM